jgi:hypothetical protein
LRIPLTYRTVGSARWLNGVTANVSTSGVLFVADSTLTRDTRIEMRLALPIQMPGTAQGRVICHGHIVRSQLADNGRTALASTIVNYRLIRADQAPE